MEAFISIVFAHSYLLVLLVFSPSVVLIVMHVHQELYSWRSPKGL